MTIMAEYVPPLTNEWLVGVYHVLNTCAVRDRLTGCPVATMIMYVSPLQVHNPTLVMCLQC